jgi:hypothetical protein
MEVKYCLSKRAALDRNGYQKNVLMERWKNMETKKLGGPWRAKQDGCQYFVQIFDEPRQFLIYDVHRLVSRLDTLREERRLRGFSRYTTFKRNYVFIVPRVLIRDCKVSEEEFLSVTTQMPFSPT